MLGVAGQVTHHCEVGTETQKSSFLQSGPLIDLLNYAHPYTHPQTHAP